MSPSIFDSRPWLKAYDPGIRSDIAPLECTHLADLATQCATKYGKLPAFTLCLPNGWTATLTFQELDSLSTAFAQFLRSELGLAPGERVAIQMPNCLPYPVAVFGIFKAGLILVNMNPLYTPDEMIHQLNDSGSKALIVLDMFADKLPTVVPKTQVRHVMTASVADLFPLIRRVVAKASLKFQKKIPVCSVHHTPFLTALSMGAAQSSKTKEPWKSSQVKPEPGQHPRLAEVAVLQYTGGTTGVSKGAMLTHQNLLSNVEQLVTYIEGYFEFNGKETCIMPIPMYHIFAFTLNMLLFFRMGNHTVLIPTPRPMVNMKPAFEKFKPTFLTGVNTLYAALLKEKWFCDKPPKSLKLCLAGGAALHEKVAEEWRNLTGTRLQTAYGLTETSPALASPPVRTKSRDLTKFIPIPSVEIRLLDDDGNEVATGQPGEIVVRGPQNMLGYWNNPEETEKSIKEGWFYTGDVATMDENGWFKIVDRKKELILVSGFNVYPNEVEDCIAKFDHVVEVGVIGVPDNKTGETVCAYVVTNNPHTTTEDIRAHCKKHLTAYKVPKLVEFRSELPKNPVGKILRRELRAEVLKNLSTSA